MENPIPILSWQAKTWGWFQAHARSRHSLWWLALVSYTDAFIFPIAPEFFLVALTLAHKERKSLFFAISASASILGAASGYAIAALFFHQFGESLLAFYHLENSFRLISHLFSSHVFLTMVISLFTPLPHKALVYTAGFLGVPFLPFILGYSIGRTLRMAIVVLLTDRYGYKVLEFFKKYSIWVGVGMYLLLAFYASSHWYTLLKFF